MKNQITPRGIPTQYNTKMWNPILFAIYFQRIDIAKMLMQDYTFNFIMVMRLPPSDEFTEYIFPMQKSTISLGVPNGGPLFENNNMRENSPHL